MRGIRSGLLRNVSSSGGIGRSGSVLGLKGILIEFDTVGAQIIGLGGIDRCSLIWAQSLDVAFLIRSSSSTSLLARAVNLLIGGSSLSFLLSCRCQAKWRD